jgi:hypothetical protein
MTEAAFQSQVRHVLAALGYTIIEVGKTRAKVKCAKCGVMSHSTGWQGNTPGAPDLYIHASWWQHPVAIAIELKTTSGRVRENQKHLANMGMTVVCRRLRAVIDTIHHYEQEHGSDIAVERIQSFIDKNEWLLDSKV